ncbi:hypothetical protein ACET3Z_028015 [Daucus carota]
MSEKSKKASMPLTKSRAGQSFICRVVEGKNQNGVLKIPSAFAPYFGRLNLNVIGLHLAFKKTWNARYVSSSETIEGIEGLLEYYDVNPCFTFLLEYIGGTDFNVELFSEYGVEVDYSQKVSDRVPMEPVFHRSDLEQEKIMATYSYSVASTFDPWLEFVITDKPVERKGWTEVWKREEAVELGLDPDMAWMHLGFEKTVWQINLKWTANKLFFDREWENLAKACKLSNGDTCFAISTFSNQRFNLAVYHEKKAMNIYQKGSVEGKGSLKWLKILNWMNLLTGELEFPHVFGAKFGSDLKDRGTIYMPDGIVYSCYLSKTAKLVFGLKDLLKKYDVKADSTMFFEYIGDSTFYASIYDSLGLERFRDLPSRLSLQSVLNYMAVDIYVISDTDEGEEEGEVGVLYCAGNSSGCHGTSDPRMQTDRDPEIHEIQYTFTVELLRSHVDQNYHGVFLPREMSAIYKKWKKMTIVKLVMKSKVYRLAILRRQKTCRLGVGWNEFVSSNNLEEGHKLRFSYIGDETFEVCITA